jgi:di/tricarboxylate transporter
MSEIDASLEELKSITRRLRGVQTTQSRVGNLFVITAMLGLFISNTATAVLIAPVAMAIAKDLGDSP